MRDDSKAVQQRGCTDVVSDAGDLQNGSFSQKDGQRYFVRLWPEPVVLLESEEGGWQEIMSIAADFNLTSLKAARQTEFDRHRTTYPETIAAIEAGKVPQELGVLPDTLRYGVEIQRRILKREALLQVIPERVLRTIRQYGGEHYALLRFIGRHPAVVELMESSPLLGFLVAMHPHWRQPSGDIDKVLSMRRRDILAWLGFHCTTEAMVRLVGKVTPQACQLHLVRGFLEAMNDPTTVRRLSFVSAVNADIMKIAASPELLSLAADALLHEVATRPDEAQSRSVSRMLDMCRHILRARGDISPHRSFASIWQIRKFCMRHADLMSSEDIAEMDCALPPPPLPETETIRALCTIEDVADEALEQENCALTLLPQIASGKLYLYRVLKPHRATLSIRKEHGRWHPNQIEWANNECADDETRHHVNTWLSAVSPGVRACVEARKHGRHSIHQEGCVHMENPIDRVREFTAAVKRDRTAKVGEVGIFWLFKGEVISDSIPYTLGEDYGDFKNGRSDHCTFWASIQRLSPEAARYEYDQVPRGRVVYSTRDDRFFVYGSETFVHHRRQKSLVLGEFNLPPVKTTFRVDEHYANSLEMLVGELATDEECDDRKGG